MVTQARADSVGWAILAKLALALICFGAAGWIATNYYLDKSIEHGGQPQRNTAIFPADQRNDEHVSPQLAQDNRETPERAAPPSVSAAPSNNTKTPHQSRATLAILLTEWDNALCQKIETTLLGEATRLGLQTVERSELASILQEQSIAASGFADRSQTLKLGHSIGADLILIIEPAGNELINLRAIETSTGVIIADAVCDSANEKQILQDAGDVLKSATNIFNVPDEDRLYISVLPFTSEINDPAHEPLAAASTALLQAALRQTPKIVLVERNELQRITQEEILGGIPIRLLGSGLIVEIGLGASDANGQIDAGLRLTPIGRGNVFSSRMKSRPDARSIVQIVTATLKQRLDSFQITAEYSTDAEVNRLMLRTQWLRSKQDGVSAMKTADAVAALSPDFEHIWFAAYYHYLAGDEIRAAQLHKQTLYLLSTDDPEFVEKLHPKDLYRGAQLTDSRMTPNTLVECYRLHAENAALMVELLRACVRSHNYPGWSRWSIRLIIAM